MNIATLVSFQDELQKIAEEHDGLNFFERHPKKLLSAAALAAGGGALLTRGKAKSPAVRAAIHEVKPLAKKVETIVAKAPAAAKEAPKAVPKAVHKPKPKKPSATWNMSVKPGKYGPEMSFRGRPKD